MSFFFGLGVLPLFLLLALFFALKKGYGRAVGVLLVLAISSFIFRIHFPSGRFEPEIFVAVQAFVICLTFIGSLLRKQSKLGFMLFGKALLGGTSTFSKADVLQLLGFMIEARKILWKNSFIVCALTELAVLTSRFTGSFRGMEIIVRQELFIVFFPILICMILTEFVFRIPEYNWFRNVPSTHTMREQMGIPTYIWVLPAMALLAIWSTQLSNYPPF